MTVHTLGQLIDCSVLAPGGERGTVIDAYFDETDWSIRFLLVRRADAKRELTVLVPSDAITDVDPNMDEIRVSRLPEQDAIASLSSPECASGRLRSSLHVLNCSVRGWDDDLGHAVDAIFETNDWMLRFLLVDADCWCSGARFLVEPDLVHEMRWEENAIAIAVTREEILHSPKRGGEDPNGMEGEEPIQARRLH